MKMLFEATKLDIYGTYPTHVKEQEFAPLHFLRDAAAGIIKVT